VINHNNNWIITLEDGDKDLDCDICGRAWDGVMPYYMNERVFKVMCFKCVRQNKVRIPLNNYEQLIKIGEVKDERNKNG